MLAARGFDTAGGKLGAARHSSAIGGTLTGTSLDQLVKSVHARLQDVARACERHVRFTPAARVLWGAEYGGLTADRPGIYGAVTARAEAQVLRLSLIYALLDEAVLAAGGIFDVPQQRTSNARHSRYPRRLPSSRRWNRS